MLNYYMTVTYRNSICLLFIMMITVITGCRNKNPGDDKNHPILFKTLTGDSTGIHFANKLTPTDSFNMFHYMYFYNGAGVGASDFNNDGLIDLFFASNQGENKIYLNQGHLHFKDVTSEAKIP